MTRCYQRLSQGMDVVTSISMLDHLKYMYIVWESRIGYISVAHIYLYLTSSAVFRTMHRTSSAIFIISGTFVFVYTS